jgi:FKBP-type peptidyl-prolyl cis-trans isomerase
MKVSYKLIITTGIFLLMGNLYATKAIPVLKTETEKFSYIIGLNMGQNFKAQGETLDPALVARGLADANSDSKPLLSAQEQQKVISNVQQKIQQKQQKNIAVSADKNAEAQAAFLAKNKTKQGIITTASGLQYEVLKPGSGASPTASATVTVNYEGKLLDGTVFDSSYKRGQPATFAVNQVIPGWTEALQLMKPGAEYMLYIPANLAYGKNGIPGTIPPNSMLIFKVELISVK